MKHLFHSLALIILFTWPLSITAQDTEESTDTQTTQSIQLDAALPEQFQALPPDGPGDPDPGDPDPGDPPPLPYVPTPGQPTIYAQTCGYTIVKQGTIPSGTVGYWQTSANGTSMASSSGSYYIYSDGNVYLRAYRATDNEWSNASYIYVDVKEVPSNPSVSGGSRCGTGTVSLTATPPPGASVYWYQGSILKASATNTYSPSLSSSITFTAKSYKGGCYSSGSSVTATVHPLPGVPSATGADRCGAGTVTLSASGRTTNEQYRWHIASSGGSPVHTTTSSSFTTPTLSSTKTYYVEKYNTSTGCKSSSRRSATATINSAPPVPAMNSQSRINPGNLTFTTDQVSNTIVELNINSATVNIGTQTSYTRHFDNTTTFTARRINSTTGCSSSNRSVTATITPLSVNTGTSTTVGSAYLAHNTYTPVGSSMAYDNFDIDGGGGGFNLALDINAGWTMSSVPAWVTIEPQYQSGSSGLTTVPVAYNSNFNSSQRREYLVINAAGEDKRIYLSQVSPSLEATAAPGTYVSATEITTPGGEAATEYVLAYEEGVVSLDIQSDVDWTLNLTGGDWLEPGVTSGTGSTTLVLNHKLNKEAQKNAVVELRYNGKQVQTLCFTKEMVNKFPVTTHKNWVETIVFGNESGRVIGQSVQYYDKLGKTTQSVARSITHNNVITSETVYDEYGRPEFVPLPVPVGQNTMNFYENYIDHNTFSDPAATQGTAFNSELHKYYSNENLAEPYVPHDTRPYSQVVYSRSIPGAVSRSYPIGDSLNARGLYSTAFTVSASPDELYKHNLNTVIELLTLDTIGASRIPRSEFEGITKSVARDVMGKESITYYNSKGQAIASCMSSITLPQTIQAGYEINPATGIDYIDIHLPEGKSSYTLGGITWEYGIRNLVSDADEADAILEPGFYRVICYEASGTHSFTVSLGYKYHSFSAYDKAGRPIRTLSPAHAEELVNGNLTPTKINRYVSSSIYNIHGQVVEAYSPDAGSASFKYRRDGKIRFSQNARQKEDSTFSYINYDKHGRVVEAGQFNEESGALLFENTGAILENHYTPGLGLSGNAAHCADVVLTWYGTAGDEAAPNGEVCRHTRGAVVKTQNSNNTTWYSYNYDGTINWVAQQMQGLDLNNDGLINEHDLVTIHYTYDFTGNTTTIVYRRGFADEFTHYYEYDLDNRLYKAYTKTYGGSKELQATYYYYAHGPLKRVELANNLQGIDYTYNINGLLKAINNPAGADPGGDAYDAFAMALDYYKGDYTRTGTSFNSSATANNYDGNIYQQRYRNKKLNAEAGQPAETQNAWQYTYDERNYLATATFGTANSAGTFTADINGAYNVFGTTAGTPISYDANGNILKLARNNAQGQAMDKFTYNYNKSVPALNRLTHITDAAGYAGLGDMGTQTPGNYTYNTIGQLIYDEYGKDGAGHEFTYNAYGKVTHIHSAIGDPIAQYIYDDRGFRIKKEDYTGGKTTWYTRDAGGNILATYKTENTTTSLLEIPVYASGRIGVAGATAGVISNYTYELTDHLGNVRATFTAGAGNNAEVLYAADYYPFGMTMPGREFKAQSYRFGYQGQYAEKDEETGYNQFQLRLYDNRIGRWLSTDPYGQYWSPYLGMGNSPIMGVDPDGGFKRKFGARWNKFWFGGNDIGYNSITKEYYVSYSFEDWGGEWKLAARYEGAGRANASDIIAHVEQNLRFEQMIKDMGGEVVYCESRLEALSRNVSDGLLPEATLITGKAISKLTNSSKVVDDVARMTTVEEYLSLMKPIDDLDPVKTLYRGSTKLDNASVIFLTDDYGVALSYSTKGTVKSIQVSEFSLKSLYQSGHLSYKLGKNGITGVTSTEYMFQGANLVEALNSLAKTE